MGVVLSFKQRMLKAVEDMERRDRQVTVLEWFMQNGLTGGVNGVFRFGADPDASYKVTQPSPLSPHFTVNPGAAVVNGELCRNEDESDITISELNGSFAIYVGAQGYVNYKSGFHDSDGVRLAAVTVLNGSASFTDEREWIN